MKSLPRHTTRAKGGVYARYDSDCGLIFYSAAKLVMYAVSPEESPGYWRRLSDDESPGVGKRSRVARRASDSPGMGEVASISHLLPSPAAWADSPRVSKPLLINWLITGNCPLQCIYCYAEDLMRGRRGEPSRPDLLRIADRIMALDPVCVVLSGGDPLFGPNIYTALPALSERVGLVVDTSGYTLVERHVALFREHQVSVRLSIDSVFPRVQDKQRPLSNDIRGGTHARPTSLNAALLALDKLLGAGIPVGVQTVATRLNVQDLPALGEQLARMGVRNWRVLTVALAEPNAGVFNDLIGPDNGGTRGGRRPGVQPPFAYTMARLLGLARGRWGGRMSVQITDNERVNAVILVGPDGKFYTESTIRPKKILIDRGSPTRPRLTMLHKAVDMHAHAARYLNTTSLRYLPEGESS